MGRAKSCCCYCVLLPLAVLAVIIGFLFTDLGDKALLSVAYNFGELDGPLLSIALIAACSASHCRGTCQRDGVCRVCSADTKRQAPHPLQEGRKGLRLQQVDRACSRAARLGCGRGSVALVLPRDDGNARVGLSVASCAAAIAHPISWVHPTSLAKRWRRTSTRTRRSGRSRSINTTLIHTVYTARS